jgi:hypothetical protein
MDRPGRFAAFRYLGDKRFQVVYDVDEAVDENVVNEVAKSGNGTVFGPDTLAEARNRGYRLRAI